jgi:hypothetical protein
MNNEVVEDRRILDKEILLLVRLPEVWAANAQYLDRLMKHVSETVCSL